MKEQIEELLKSHINGNLSYVRKKFKNMRTDKKKEFILYALEQLDEREFKFLINSIYG